jgi:glutathione synthase/RimK-type ligase-like ATP-grasp enzyme
MLIYAGRASDGARNLATALNSRRALETGPAYTGHLINWGNTALPNRFRNATVINDPEDVAVVSNKLTFFRQFAGEGPRAQLVPWWTTNREIAARRMNEEGTAMVCRRVLNGSGGAGIVIAHNTRELVDAPLYVDYVKKKDEYRIHIMNGHVIDMQRKAKREGVDNPNWEVRNLEGGFIYARHNLDVPVAVTQAAERCMEALDLDFGAVDVIWNAKSNRAYVLEVNSAPGLEGTTVERYAQAFRENYPEAFQRNFQRRGKRAR